LDKKIYTNNKESCKRIKYIANKCYQPLSMIVASVSN